MSYQQQNVGGYLGVPYIVMSGILIFPDFSSLTFHQILGFPRLFPIFPVM